MCGMACCWSPTGTAIRESQDLALAHVIARESFGASAQFDEIAAIALVVTLIGTCMTMVGRGCLVRSHDVPSVLGMQHARVLHNCSSPDEKVVKVSRLPNGQVGQSVRSDRDAGLGPSIPDAMRATSFIAQVIVAGWVAVDSR